MFIIAFKEQIQFSLLKTVYSEQNKTIQKKAKIVHKNKGLNEQLNDIVMKRRYETLVYTLFKRLCTCVSCIGQCTGAFLLNTKPHWVKH